MQLQPIEEQVVVVVGASSGIGREVALRLAKRGASVVVAARSEPGLRSLWWTGSWRAAGRCPRQMRREAVAMLEMAKRQQPRLSTRRLV